MDSDLMDSVDLPSGEGRFIAPLALLLMPDESNGQEKSVALHEYSHAETFMGSEHYGAYASRAMLTGDFAIRRHVAEFAEAVPSFMAELGGRHQYGTCPDQEALNLLVEATRAYSDRFRSEWMAYLKTPNQASLSEEYLFLKTVGMSIVKAALARAETERGDSGDLRPVELVKTMIRRLTDRSMMLVSIMPNQTLDNHVMSLMLGGTRTFSSMLGPQVLLAEILMKCKTEDILKHMPLVSAIARLEFMVEAWKPRFTQASFFVHQSSYHVQRINDWLVRVGAYPHRAGALNAMADLRLCFAPLAINQLAVIPRQYSDPAAMDRVQLILSLISIRQFFRSFPSFLRWFIDRNLLARSIDRELDCLQDGADAAASGYSQALEVRIAKHQGRAIDTSLANLDALYKLVPAKHRQFGEVLEVVLK